MSSIGKSETTRDTAVCGGGGGGGSWWGGWGGANLFELFVKNITFPAVTFQNGRLINLLIGDP